MRSMIIAQISDTHIDLEGPNGAARGRDLERCVADINGLDPLPDVVVHTGDMSQHGTPAEYREAARILSALRCRFVAVAGNRDDRDAIRTTFPADTYLLPDTPYFQYCVSEFPVRLIVLDTLSATSNQGEFCQVRADSLRAALTKDPASPTALFMHHPPFEVRESKYPIQFASWDSVERLGRVLDGQRHIVGAFCGHAHRLAEGMVGGVPVRTMPSVAVDLRLGDYPAAHEAVPLYRVHRFDPARGIVSETRAAQPCPVPSAETGTV